MNIEFDGYKTAETYEAATQPRRRKTLGAKCSAFFTWSTGYTFKRNWEWGTLEITQKAFVEILLNHFGVNSSSDIAATPGVELVPREEGAPRGGWPYGEAMGSLM